MMIARIARDRAFRSLPIFVVAAGVNTSVLLGILAWKAAGSGSPVPTWALVLTAWSGVALYLAFGHLRSRCSHFDMSLPIPTRSLWLGHLLAVLVGGALVAALGLGAIALHRRLIGPRVSFGTSDLMLAALLGAGLLLATLLLTVPRRSLAKIPVTAGYVSWAALVLVGTPLLLTAVSRGGGVAVAFLLAASIALGGWLYRATPSAFELLPREAGAADRGASGESLAAAPSKLVLPLTVLRGVSAGAKELAGLPFLVMFGMVLGGALRTVVETAELRFIYIPMVTYMLFAFVGPRLMYLHFLDPLPIRRRTICAALFLPNFLLLCAGYGAGALLDNSMTSRLEWVDFAKIDDGYVVTAPLRVYEIARDGSPTAARSPWGESHLPEGLNPWRGSRAVMYSPYETAPGSSERFVALQISRAVEAAYGASIPPEEIAARYLTTGEDGKVVPRGEGLALRADYPELRVRSGPMFPVLIALSVVPWLLLSALFLRAYRAGVKEWVRQTTYWTTFVLLLGCMVVQLILVVTGTIRDWAIRGLVEIPVMQLGTTAAGTAAVWIVTVLAIASAYAIAAGLFRRMEISTKPSMYTLLDRIHQG